MNNLRIDARMALANYESSYAAFGAEASFTMEDVYAVREYIDTLETALIHIWSYPTNVSNPRQQINEMKDFAFKVIKEGNEDAKSD